MNACEWEAEIDGMQICRTNFDPWDILHYIVLSLYFINIHPQILIQTDPKSL